MSLITFLLIISMPYFTSGFFINWQSFARPPSNKVLYPNNSYQHNEGYSFQQSFCPPLRSPDVKHFQLNYTYGLIAPDNFLQQAILTNGKFPGDPIRVKQGDTIIVKVCNFLAAHNLTIHFHGILQKYTTRSDGIPFVTQDPIRENHCYQYIMYIGSQVGTFLYHAHTELDLIWAHGAFIIKENFKYIEKYKHRGLKSLKTIPAYDYYQEIIISLSQCWHTPTSTMYHGILAAPFVKVPNADSILINGKSPGDNRNSSDFTIISVKKGKCYRFRIIGVGPETMLQFSIYKHSFTVVEADGIIINPIKTNYLNLNSAQRYSCIVCMNEDIGNYAMSAIMIPGPGPKNGVAILHYKGAPDPTTLLMSVNISGQTEKKEIDTWILDRIRPSSQYRQLEVYPTPVRVSRSIIIKSYQVTQDNGSVNFYINKHYVPVPERTLIDVVQNTTEPFPPPFEAGGILDILFGEDIQMVFVNLFGKDQNCEQHPWHLHGHTFHIVGMGPDDYREHIEGVAVQKRVEENYRIGKPYAYEFRDVLTLFANRTDRENAIGTPCGWTAIRFKADNPGLWFVHCHVTKHLIMGKRFVMYEHTREDPRLQHQC